MRREQLHVTLSFFPALPVTCVEKIREILETLGSLFAPYQAVLCEVGTFPSWQRARVLWIGLDEEGRKHTAQIEKFLLERLRKIDIGVEEERKFIPHVTLARFRSPMALQSTLFAEWSPLSVSIEEIALFESILTPSGPIYQKLVNVTLKG